MIKSGDGMRLGRQPLVFIRT